MLQWLSDIVPLCSARHDVCSWLPHLSCQVTYFLILWILTRPNGCCYKHRCWYQIWWWYWWHSRAIGAPEEPDSFLLQSPLWPWKYFSPWCDPEETSDMIETLPCVICVAQNAKQLVLPEPLVQRNKNNKCICLIVADFALLAKTYLHVVQQQNCPTFKCIGKAAYFKLRSRTIAKCMQRMYSIVKDIL